MSSAGPSRVVVPTFGGYAPSTGMMGVSFWPRVAARGFDALTHFGIAVAASLVFSIGLVMVATIVGQPWEPLVERLGSSTLSSFTLGLLGAIGYQTICEGMVGSSLGKRILGIVVVMESGSPCTMRAALVRSLSYIIDALSLGVVAYMAMGTSPLKQRHGDRWARTVVVYLKNLPAERLRSGGRFFLALVLGILFDASLILLSFVLDLI